MAYSAEQLKYAVNRRIDSDARFARDVGKALNARNRGWLESLIIAAAKWVFGEVVSGVVAAVLDWLFGD